MSRLKQVCMRHIQRHSDTKIFPFSQQDTLTDISGHFNFHSFSQRRGVQCIHCLLYSSACFSEIHFYFNEKMWLKLKLRSTGWSNKFWMKYWAYLTFLSFETLTLTSPNFYELCNIPNLILQSFGLLHTYLTCLSFGILLT